MLGKKFIKLYFRQKYKLDRHF